MLQTSKLSSRSQSKSDSGFQIQQGQETCGITKEQYKRLLTYCNIFIMEEKKFVDTNITSGAINFAAALVRYQIAGNFLGLPAVTIPVGYDMSGLPIGLQFIGKPWNESLLIHIAFAMQALCISEYKRPEVFFDLLGK
ncbi:fatty acid amide hydrolase-like [Nicotiana tomentosiformis]|uniref:fatty acid amide hydrolase-like n=1 Tax=Nicotiana tomentosiformis TaxID=4098 RepID=UPI00388CC115